ncbi:unnamed protein product [Paramecium pentaurelia]|uniref:non-specific serine/threonine protein kinase n=1 Tax=Paramecium pentaurelia TaxID=43138 RepID=A0A8S1Y768_9CILI|nr:unnamed protein product [Paramecium pentaurelia]
MYWNHDPEEEFELLELIGEGAYATVYKGRHKEDGQIVAIKIIPMVDEIENLVQEIKILKDCQHPNIVSFLGSYYKDSNLWLIMEYCSGGSVLGLMEVMERGLNQEEISGIMYSTLLGIEYLHQNKKIHRDIKAGNILLDHKGQVKLADFGVAAQLTYSCADKGTFIGTPFWMSPEVISKSRYNQLTDIWSLGVTAIELAEGTPPYSHIHPVRAMFAIKNNPPMGLTKPELWSKEFNQFVQGCLRVEVNERPTAQQLLQYTFIKQGKLHLKKLLNLVEQYSKQLEEARLNKLQKNENSQQSIKDQVPLTIISNCEQIDDDDEISHADYGTLVIKDQMIQMKEEPDFLKWNKMDQQISDHQKKKVEHQKELSLEAQIQNMNLEERKRLKNQIEQQMNEELEQIKKKYSSKLDLLNIKIKEEEDKRKQQYQPLNLPFSFQVSQEVLQQLANVKTPLIKCQQVKQAKPPPFEFIPKQKL